METPKIACFVLAECLDSGTDKGRLWVYDMARVPQVGERIEGDEVSNPGSAWEVQLVISDPKIVAMLDAMDLIDLVADQGDGFAVTFNKLLIAVVAGQRVI